MNIEVIMNTKQTSKLWVDITLFAGFIVAFFLDLTGVALHQWIGMLGGALAGYHLIVQWDWVEAVNRRFFGRTSGRARLYYLMDGMILIGFASIIGTGLLISTWLNLSLTYSEAWRVLHILASIATLLVVLVKLSLHWRWIALAARCAFARPVPAQSSPVPQRRMPASRGISRGEFIGVMGVVSLASFLALINASQGLANVQSPESDASSSSTSVQTGSSSSAFSSSETSSCMVRCGRGCSYPGHCRRYTDGNNNGLCDYGECL
jgi:hypothetical protein